MSGIMSGMTQSFDAEVAAGVVYHLTTKDEWEAAQTAGVYDRSTRDKSLTEVGFIHCSLPSQLTKVAEFVYGGCTEELVVLVMHLTTLADHGVTVRFDDDGNGTLYPHIYAALPCRLVDDVVPALMDGARFTFSA